MEVIPHKLRMCPSVMCSSLHLEIPKVLLLEAVFNVTLCLST